MIRVIRAYKTRNFIEVEQTGDKLVVVDPARSGAHKMLEAFFWLLMSSGMVVLTVWTFFDLRAVLVAVFGLLFTTIMMALSLRDALRDRVMTNILVVDGETYEYRRRTTKGMRTYHGPVSSLRGFVRWDGPIQELFLETGDGLLPFYRVAKNEVEPCEEVASRLNERLDSFLERNSESERQTVYQDEKIRVSRGPKVLSCESTENGLNIFDFLARPDGLVVKHRGVIRALVPWESGPRMYIAGHITGLSTPEQKGVLIYLFHERERVMEIVSEFIREHSAGRLPQCSSALPDR